MYLSLHDSELHRARERLHKNKKQLDRVAIIEHASLIPLFNINMWYGVMR